MKKGLVIILLLVLVLIVSCTQIENLTGKTFGEAPFLKKFASKFFIPEIPPECEEVIPGHNRAERDRINIVFIGLNYDDSDVFKEDIGSALDYSGKYYGLFYVEPFKSNKNKFNFWYVKEIGEISRYTPDSLVPRVGEEALSKINELSQKCPLSNKKIINLIHWNFKPYANYGHQAFVPVNHHASSRCLNQLIYCSNVDSNDDGQVDGRDSYQRRADYDEDEILNGENEEENFEAFQILKACIRYSPWAEKWREPKSLEEIEGICFEDWNSPRIVTHEFGHVFGYLEDEYIRYMEEPPTPYSTDNCFYAQTVEECLNNAPWKHLIGAGCGEPDLIDCSQIDRNFTLEVGCYEGCTHSQKRFRSVFNSIMRVDSVIWMPFSFGLANEEVLRKKINDYLGLPTKLDLLQHNFKIMKEMKVLSKIKKIPRKVLQLSLKYDKGKISKENLKIVKGYFNLPKEDPQNGYLLIFKSKKNKVLYAQKFVFPLKIHAAPLPEWFDEKGNQIYIPEEKEIAVETAFKEILIPYFKEGRKIEVYDSKKVKVWEIDLFEYFCGDRVCQEHESYLNCAKDCRKGVWGKVIEIFPMKK